MPERPSADELLTVRRALSDALGRSCGPEIMTLAEVAAYLRLSPEEMGEIIEELPAFELAGQVRVRRAKLREWVEQRERQFASAAAMSWTTRALALDSEKGAA